MVAKSPPACWDCRTGIGGNLEEDPFELTIEVLQRRKVFIPGKLVENRIESVEIGRLRTIEQTSGHTAIDSFPTMPPCY